jgi:hypothetical protein
MMIEFAVTLVFAIVTVPATSVPVPRSTEVPSTWSALRFVTLVVLATVSGAVPVVTVEVIVGLVTALVTNNVPEIVGIVFQ